MRGEHSDKRGRRMKPCDSHAAGRHEALRPSGPDCGARQGVAAGWLPGEMQFRRYAIAPAHLTTWSAVMLPRRTGSLRTERKERTNDPYTPALLAAGTVATRMLSKRKGRIRALRSRFPHRRRPQGLQAGGRVGQHGREGRQEEERQECPRAVQRPAGPLRARRCRRPGLSMAALGPSFQSRRLNGYLQFTRAG